MVGTARRGLPLDQTLDRSGLHSSSTCHRALQSTMTQYLDAGHDGIVVTLVSVSQT